MSRAKVYGLLMALAMLFMACLCACSAQPHSAAETAPQTIVVGIDVFDPYSYLAVSYTHLTLPTILLV